MPDLPPILALLAAPSDRAFCDELQQRLLPRGLGLTIGLPLASPIPTQPIILLVVISADSLQMPNMQQALNHAAIMNWPIIPLRRDARASLPVDIQSLQWADFSQSFEAGWQALLVTLDTLECSRFPAAPRFYDVEVIMARVATGQISPTWQVYRGVRPQVTVRWHDPARALPATAYVVIGMLVAINVTFAVFTSAPWLWGLVAFIWPLCIGLSSIIAYYTVRDRRFVNAARGSELMLVVTPFGLACITPAENIYCPFASVAEIVIQPATTFTGVLLACTQKDGATAVGVPVLQMFGAVNKIAHAAQDAFIAYDNHHSATSHDSPLIFMSYARQDSVFVDELEKTLRDRLGLRLWMDRSYLSGGQKWSYEIQQAIAASSVMLFVVSPTSVLSAEVQREYHAAQRLNIPIIAYYAEKGVTLPPDLIPAAIIRTEPRWPLRSINELLVALHDQGFFTPQTLEETAWLTIAQHAIGKPVPGALAFKARYYPVPTNLLITVPMVLLLCSTLAIIPIIGVSIGGYFVALLLIHSVTIALISGRRSQLSPPMIVIAKNFFTMPLTGSASIGYYQFDKITSIQIQRISSPYFGLRLMILDTYGHPYQATTLGAFNNIIPYTFRHRRRIARHIQAAWQQHQQKSDQA